MRCIVLTTESTEAQRGMKNGISRKKINVGKNIDPIHEAQLLTYMRITTCTVGLLINFNKPTLIDGVKRFVL